MYSERIPAKEYAKLADQFFPAPRCAEEWVETACAAGAKYMVLTTRHHEGFCLFDSKYSDFTSAKCGCKRDIVAEYVEAARKAGLPVEKRRLRRSDLTSADEVLQLSWQGITAMAHVDGRAYMAIIGERIAQELENI